MHRITCTIPIAFVLSLLISLSYAGCDQYKGCGECTSDVRCVWCNTNSSCDAGSFYGGEHHCKGWQWRQCKGIKYLLYEMNFNYS